MTASGVWPTDLLGAAEQLSHLCGCLRERLVLSDGSPPMLLKQLHEFDRRAHPRTEEQENEELIQHSKDSRMKRGARNPQLGITYAP